MKHTKTLILTVSLGLASLLNAAESIKAGPKGGRLLENTQPAVEVYVNEARKVEVNFYDAAGKPLAPAAQSVAVTAEPKSGKAALEMEKTATGFVSRTPAPEGEPYRLVVQYRETADARPQNYRITLNLEECGGCGHAEYACTCGH